MIGHAAMRGSACAAAAWGKSASGSAGRAPPPTKSCPAATSSAATADPGPTAAWPAWSLARWLRGLRRRPRGTCGTSVVPAAVGGVQRRPRGTGPSAGPRSRTSAGSFEIGLGWLFRGLLLLPRPLHCILMTTGSGPIGDSADAGRDDGAVGAPPPGAAVGDRARVDPSSR